MALGPLGGPSGPLAALTVGEGPRATVLLHGFLGSAKNLRTLAQRWAERQPERRFLVPDLRGHGDSPPLGPEVDLDALARDVLATAQAAGLTLPLALVGHSLGGRVALAAARLDPGRLGEVVLLDIAPGRVDPLTSESRQVLDLLLAAPNQAADRRQMRAFFLDRGLGPGLADWLLMNLVAQGGRYVWRVDRRALEALHDRSLEEDLWPVVEARSIPIRCIRGGRSRYVTDADAARLKAARCPVDTLPGAGHFMHVDALEPLLDRLCSPGEGTSGIV
jgi:esterase